MSGNTSLGFTLQFQVWINICTSVAARHPWDMKAITVGVLYKTKRLICWGAVVVQRQTRLVGSICSSFWVVLGKVTGQLGLGAGGIVILQHLEGNSNMLPPPTDFWLYIFWAMVPPRDLFYMGEWGGEMQTWNPQVCAKPWDTSRKDPVWLNDPGKYV